MKSPEILTMAIYMIIASSCENPAARRVYENCKRLMVKAIVDEFPQEDPEALINSFFEDTKRYTNLRTKIVFECCGKSHLPKLTSDVQLE